MARMSARMREQSERKSTKNKSREDILISKKQKALCKQATDLSVLCGIEFAIIIFSVAGDLFIHGKPDVESVVDQFLQAQSLTECSTSCKCTIEKIHNHKRHGKMNNTKTLTIDDKGKGKAIQEDFECPTPKNFEIDSESEKQLIEAMKVFEKDLNEKINELQAKIRAKDGEIGFKKISSTTPSSWLSL